MNATIWDTRKPIPAGFEDAWAARLRGAPFWNFSMELAAVRTEAALGRHARLALLEADGRRGAIVLRDTTQGWVSGSPWRWQVALEAAPDAPLAFSLEDARWAYRQCAPLTEGRRLMLNMPVAPAGDAPAYFIGATLIKDMRVSEDEMLASIDSNKRRSIKRAAKDGYVISTATTHEQWRAFAELQREVDARHGLDPGPIAASPGPGEAWREWEHPWMWLLVAEREGKVEAGSGFGITAGGQIDYRTNASTSEALKSGANVALAWEALRQGRERGMRFMNWGGVTEFKRYLRGDRFESHCWLGGGPLWVVPNQLMAGVRVARSKIAARVKSLKKKSD